MTEPAFAHGSDDEFEPMTLAPNQFDVGFVGEADDLEHQLAQAYLFGGDLAEEAMFGWNPLKAVASVVKTVAKVAVAPIKIATQVTSVIPGVKQVMNLPGLKQINAVANAPGKALVNIAEGGNVLANLKTLAPAAQAALSFIPGAGTLVSMGLGAGLATLEGKSLKDIASGALTGAVPGGPLVTMAANVAGKSMLAGINGQNMAKAAAREVVTNAVNMIPDKTAANLLNSVVADALAGKNILASAQSAAVNAALGKVTDASAKAMFTSVLQGKLSDPKALLQAVPAKVIAHTLLNAPQGQLAQTVAQTMRTISGPSGISPPVRPISPAGRTIAQTVANASSVVNKTPTGAVLSFKPGASPAAVVAITAAVVASTKSADAAKAAAAATIAQNTAAAARLGDKGAQVALNMMATTADAAKAAAAKAILTAPAKPQHRIIVDIDAQGRIKANAS